MSITSIQQTWASLGAQQASALSAVPADPFDVDDGTEDGTGDSAPATAAGSNALTGTGTASLDSQTLAALLGLTQNDPTDDSSGDSAVQAQGAHRHHNHHGGAAQSTDQGSDTATAAAPDPSIAETASSATGDSDASDSLSQVLAQI